MSIQQSPGIIYLADARGFVENEVHRCYSTFNFLDYQEAHRQPFKTLNTFNNETLPAGGSMRQMTTVDGILLLIPVVGVVECVYDGKKFDADAGEVLSVRVKAGEEICIHNPYSSNWVNFLFLEIKSVNAMLSSIEKHSFNMAAENNLLIPVLRKKEFPLDVHIGRFSSRFEVSEHVQSGQAVFAFVIGGAFELQNRLLHEGDGLALWEIREVEAEALSDDAVLLLLKLNDVA